MWLSHFKRPAQSIFQMVSIQCETWPEPRRGVERRTAQLSMSTHRNLRSPACGCTTPGHKVHAPAPLSRSTAWVPSELALINYDFHNYLPLFQVHVSYFCLTKRWWRWERFSTGLQAFANLQREWIPKVDLWVGCLELKNARIHFLIGTMCPWPTGSQAAHKICRHYILRMTVSI